MVGTRADNPSQPDHSVVAQPVKYMQEVDWWFDELTKRGASESDFEFWARVHNGVKAKLIESYRNGKKEAARTG